MAKIIERTKYNFVNGGYFPSNAIIEVKNFYEAKEYIKRQLELCKRGDENWHEEQQNFDRNSIYITNGHIIYWYEYIE